KILGDSSRYDGGQHLRIVETTSKLNGVALGNGLFLNEVPNSRLKTTEEKAVYNRRDLLNIVGGLGANGGGREYTFIQDPGQKTAGKFYLDQNTMGIYKCVTNTSSVNNDSSFEKIDLDATTAKLNNLDKVTKVNINKILNVEESFNTNIKGYKFVSIKASMQNSSSKEELTFLLTLGQYGRFSDNSSILYYYDGVIGCGFGAIIVKEAVFFN
ncbi:MAG: hypothetical protein ACRC7S_03715, partial [Cetobacterium sp.]